MKYITLVFLAILMANISFAQDRDQMREGKIEAQKVSFITSKLDLSVEEAQKFWPVYNEFEASRKELGRGPENNREIDFDSLSDEDAKAMLNDMIAHEDKMHQLKKDFINKVKNVLPPVKVLQLHRLEGDFRRSLLKRFKNRHDRGDRKEMKKRGEKSK